MCHGFNNVPVKEYDKKRLPFPFLEGITNIIICRTDCLTALSEYYKNTCILYIDNVIVRTEEQTKAERAVDCETKETHDTKVEKVGR